MVTTNNVIRLQVNNGTGDLVTAAGTTITALTAGLSGFFDTAGISLTWDDTNEVFKNGSSEIINQVRFVTKNADGTIKQSDIIEWDKVLTNKRDTYLAASEQLDYVGFDGTDGSIDDTLLDNVYKIDIEEVSNMCQFGGRAGNPELKYGVYLSNATATNQYDIATGLTKSLVKNYSREVDKAIKFETLCAENTTVIAVTPTATFANGIDTVIMSATVAGTLSIGDALRAGVAVTDPIYKIIKVDTTVVTLDTVYQGVDATGVTVEGIAKATAEAADCGIKFTGLPLYFDPLKFKYEKSRWTFQLIDCGSTTANIESTSASKGVGTYESISELERQVEGTDTLGGSRLGTPPPVFDHYADSALTYDVNYIRWFNQSTEAMVGHDPKSYKELVIVNNTAATKVEWAKVFG